MSNTLQPSTSPEDAFKEYTRLYFETEKVVRESLEEAKQKEAEQAAKLHPAASLTPSGKEAAIVTRKTLHGKTAMTAQGKKNIQQAKEKP